MIAPCFRLAARLLVIFTIKNKSDSKEKEAILCLNIAHVFSAKSQLSNAKFEGKKTEEFINRSFNALMKIDTVKKTDIYISTLNSFGNMYRKKAFVTDNNILIDKALIYFKLALASAKNKNNLEKIPLLEINLGSTYLDNGDLDKAKEYYDLAYNKWADTKNNAGYSLALLNIAHLAFKKIERIGEKEYLIQSENFANRSLDTAIKYKDVHNELAVYDFLSNIYDKANNPGKSLYFYKKFFFLNDSLFNERNIQEAAYLSNDFLLSENRKKINDLLINQKLASLQIEKEKNYRWFLFIIVIILIISIAFILAAFNGRKKNK